MPTPDAVAAAMTAKRYEAFWIRGAGWTFCASEPDTEDATIDIELVPASDYSTLETRCTELQRHEQHTHESLSAILGDDDSLEQKARQLKTRCAELEAALSFCKQLAESAREMKSARQVLNVATAAATVLNHIDAALALLEGVPDE